jgi:putative heme-binding domain-containing protein
LAFDDWGNRFICNIRNPIRHAVFPDEAMKRHPLLRYPPPVVDVAIAGDTIAVYRTSPPEPWRVLNAERLAADRTAGSPRSESVAAGYMTSACGLTIYRGSAYPPRFYGQAFLGEVAGNLIHRQQLEPRGVTFAAHRIDERSEFVTSDDNWFRPVNFANAPDGTLYVLDMYRETIEHPWSIPDDLKEHLDLESGRDRGRIYRLAPPGFQYRAPLWPGNTSTEELVRLLGHPNGWHRDTAHRLLFERQDTAAIEPLRKWIRGQTMAETPYLTAVAVVLALWSLEGLNALEVEDLASAFEHSDEHVREHAIRLAAGRMDEPVLELIRRALRDVSPRVRFQAWLAVAAYPQNVRRTLLLHGLESLEEDLWLQTAWLSATQGLERELLEAWLSHVPTADPAMPQLHAVVTLAETLAEVVTVTSKPQDLDPLWQRLPLPYAAGHAAPLVECILSGILEGARRRGMRIEQWTRSPAAQSVWRQWTEYEVEVVCDQQSSLARRTRAVRIAAQAPWEKIRPWMEKLFSALEPPQLQLAAVRAAIEHANEGGIDILLEHYRRLSPAVRTECISLLVGRSDSAYRLLTAIQQGKISTAELTPTHCALLMRSSREDVKSLARQLLSENQTQRADVVQQYRNALSGRGDPRAGETVFRRVCANCHRVRDIGTDVGPPLETVLHRSKYELLLHILDPNREVMPQYQEYIAVLADGRITTGILMEESPTTVCLRRAGGHQENLARSDLAELTATGKSLMPEGLEREITPAQMDDLLSFLLDATPGNR